MPWVRTACYGCGLVTVPAEELTVVLDENPPRYSFRCPACDRTVVRVAGNGNLEAFRVLPDVVEAEVARFRDLLEQDDWFEQLLVAGDRPDDGRRR